MTEHLHRGHPADDKLLTVVEVAVIVRAPVATLRYWRHLGVWPCGFRVGRGLRYWRQDVIDWLDEQRSSTGLTRPELSTPSAAVSSLRFLTR
jgi:hypothetical protein